jgi:protein-L-isoaspartate(D-aspartate) O-methyltransferase
MPDGVPTSVQDLRRRDLTRHLRIQGIHDARVLAAMASVPRERFVNAETADWAYEDRALSIDCGQTISQPYIVALMTEALELTGSERVLEIGTGSGYQTAILSRLAAEVFTIERHPELAHKAQHALAKFGASNVRFHIGDGSIGWPDAAPFDRVIVTAAAQEFPATLWAQLAPNGILVAPVGDSERQLLQAWSKTPHGPEARPLCECRFVPLVSE